MLLEISLKSFLNAKSDKVFNNCIVQNNIGDEFYTSIYDLSKFNSIFFGAEFMMAPSKVVFNIQHLNALEIKFCQYKKQMDKHVASTPINLLFTYQFSVVKYYIIQVACTNSFKYNYIILFKRINCIFKGAVDSKYRII